MQGELEESQNIVTASRHRYITVLRADVKQLHADLLALQAELGEFMLLGDIRQADERCAMAHALQQQLDTCATWPCCSSFSCVTYGDAAPNVS